MYKHEVTLWQAGRAAASAEANCKMGRQWGAGVARTTARPRRYGDARLLGRKPGGSPRHA